MVLLAALGLLDVAFVPFARLLDHCFPGPHMGFHLVGIWLILVLPGSLVLAVATLVTVAYDVIFQKIARPTFVVATLASYLLFFLAAQLYYRLG